MDNIEETEASSPRIGQAYSVLYKNTFDGVSIEDDLDRLRSEIYRVVQRMHMFAGRPGFETFVHGSTPLELVYIDSRKKEQHDPLGMVGYVGARMELGSSDAFGTKPTGEENIEGFVTEVFYKYWSNTWGSADEIRLADSNDLEDWFTVRD